MELNHFASLFKSLFEPVRLRILYLLLEQGELCVCDIAKSLELSQIVVSRHLTCLRNSGLLNARREGVWIYYQLIENYPFSSALLECFRRAGSASLVLEDDVEQLKVAGRQSC